MSLPDLWQKTPEQIEGKHIQQIIAFAGSGRLRDDDNASQELRRFLSMIPSARLEQYATECLSSKFEGNGLALQDIVNEVGSRLGFGVDPGRYRAGAGHVSFDGLWRSPEGHALVIEVKTTDAYRMSLDTFANYRRALVKGGELAEDGSSILIVVGREDTGDLEAQIRGSRHTWDIRLISVDALLRLMKLKEETEEPAIHRKIREILVPLEFTKVDAIIDFVFSAKRDVEEHEEREGVSGHKIDTESPDQQPKPVAVSFHEACAARIQSHLKQPLVRRTRTLFAAPSDALRIIIAVSRVHDASTAPNYWFAFHPHQKERLAETSEAYVAFGCGSEEAILLIPFQRFAEWLDGLWTTQREPEFYWHVVIHREDSKFVLRRKKGFERIDLTGYLL